MSDQLPEQIAGYVDETAGLFRSNGRIYSTSWQGDVLQVREVSVGPCPVCGELTQFQQQRSACCGQIIMTTQGGADE